MVDARMSRLFTNIADGAHLFVNCTGMAERAQGTPRHVFPLLRHIGAAVRRSNIIVL